MTRRPRDETSQPKCHGRRAETALAIIAAHNLVQNLLLNERGYVTGNLAVTGLLVGLGRASGISWEQMGLGRDGLGSSLGIGKRAAGVGVAIAVLALSGPRTRAILRDERAVATSGRQIWERVLLRFPFGTALFEEVAFRGVLPALWRQNHRIGSGDVVSAAAFGLWHLIPTCRALSGNPLGRDVSGVGRLAVIVGGSAAAGMSGLALSRIKRHTGSLLAPWLIHTSFNGLSYLAGVAALRLPAKRPNTG